MSGLLGRHRWATEECTGRHDSASYRLDVVSEVLQRFVVKDHAAVEDERRLQHAVVDSLVVVRLQCKKG